MNQDIAVSRPFNPNQAGQPTAPCPSESLGSVMAGMTQLEKQLAVLHERARELGGRLDPVLTPPIPPAPKRASDAHVTASPIAEHLRGLCDGVLVIQNDLESILARINL